MIILLLSLLQAQSISPSQIETALGKIGETRAALNREMIDYPNARFRDVFVSVRTATGPGAQPYLCGYVNGPNRAGGYTGWQRFMASGDMFFIESNRSDRMIVSVTCESPDVLRDDIDRSQLLAP